MASLATASLLATPSRGTPDPQQDTDFPARVQIADHEPLGARRNRQPGRPPHDNVLADRADKLLDHLGHHLSPQRPLQEHRRVCGLRIRPNHGRQVRRSGATNLSVRATKSVSRSTSTSAPTFAAGDVARPPPVHPPRRARLFCSATFKPALAAEDLDGLLRMWPPAFGQGGFALHDAPRPSCRGGRAPVVAEMVHAISFCLPISAGGRLRARGRRGTTCHVGLDIRHAGLGPFAAPLDGGVRQPGTDQPDGPDRVVVPGDGKIHFVRIAVGIHHRHHRDGQPARFADRDALLLRVDDEERPDCSIPLMPMKELFSFCISRSNRRTSFLAKASNLPVAFMSSSCLRREMLLVMVRKLVRMPPSQRRLTKYMPERLASSAMASCACFFVPTNRTVPRGRRPCGRTRALP